MWKHAIRAFVCSINELLAKNRYTITVFSRTFAIKSVTKAEVLVVRWSVASVWYAKWKVWVGAFICRIKHLQPITWLKVVRTWVRALGCIAYFLGFFFPNQVPCCSTPVLLARLSEKVRWYCRWKLVHQAFICSIKERLRSIWRRNILACYNCAKVCCVFWETSIFCRF